MFKKNIYLSALCKTLYNRIKGRTVDNRITIYTVGGSKLGLNGALSQTFGLGIHYTALPEHCVDSGLLEQGLNCLEAKELITLDKEDQVSQISSPAPIEVKEQISNSCCDSVKENLKERPYIAFFVVAAAALLAGGAVALTTYFHVGTTLMLSAGFIPFLNFVGGFQISLLLGVISIATFSAGGIYAIAKTLKCCDERCNEEQHLEATSSSSENSSSSQGWSDDSSNGDSEPAETDDKAVAVNE
jgi:hypothetical protein